MKKSVDKGRDINYVITGTGFREGYQTTINLFRKECFMRARFMAGALAVVTAVSFVSAQEFATSVEQGKWAGLFSFSGLSYLGAGSYNGGIGAKFYLSNNMAIRGGLQFAHASLDVLPTPTPTPPNSGLDGYRHGTKFGVSAAVEYHLLPTRVSPYIGGGAGFSSASTEDKTAVIGNPPNEQNQQVTKNLNGGETIKGITFDPGLSLNVGALAGVEFFITKEVSLSAEYLIGYSMLSPSDQEVTLGPTTTTTPAASSSSINVSATGVLTLAIYF
jgi:opacity protein-like surface antigen